MSKVIFMLKYIRGDVTMALLSIFPFLQGANELHVVFILDIVLLSLLLFKIYKNKKLIFTKDIKFILILIWSFFYLLTTFYSVDTELAFLGFLKLFSVPIFLLLVMQYEYTEEERSKWFGAIGRVGVVMVVICVIWSLLFQRDTFFYQNRLAGFFNYANSFAVFLLIGFISTGFKKNFSKLDYGVMSILLSGIILTNSRSMMIITLVSYLALLIFGKVSKREKFLNTGILLVVGICVVFVVGLFGVSNRIGTTSGNAGEWLLRLLYYKDAVRMLGENIWGYGHMAWWYMQEGLQTGAYDARYVHNGLLQVALDAGVIPALLIVIMFVKAFFEKNRSVRDKVLMVVILGHAFIDFDMEFLAITLPRFMTLEFDKKTEIKNNSLIKAATLSGVIVYSFFGVVTILNKVEAYDISNKLFAYSLALDGELVKENDFTKRVEIAEELYEKNKYFLNASKILSQKEQIAENYEKANEYEFWIVRNKKYTMKNYIEYVQFLEDSIRYYYSVNDIEGVKVCVERLNAVRDRIEEVKDTSDELAYEIVHKPRLDMPEEMNEYINSMNEFCESLR